MILADPGFIRKPSAGGLPRRNSGLRVSWTPGTSFLSQSVLWLCGARETRNHLFPTLRIKDNDIIMNTIADSGDDIDVITGKQKDTYEGTAMKSGLSTSLKSFLL